MGESDQFPLSGLRVVDATTSVAGQFASKLFAANGADVVLVEPPSGSPTRRMPPMPKDDPSAPSYLFEHLNQGKRSIVLDLSQSSGELLDLLARADVLLHDRDLALQRPEHVVTCEVADFPEGPYRDWKGCELVHQALSGSMYMTGDPARQPLYGMGQRAYYAAGVVAYTTVLAALAERRRSGSGQETSATVFESAAAMAQNLLSQYSYNGTYPTRERYPGFLAMLRCADGWVVLFALRNWDAVCDVFDAPQLKTDPRFVAPGARLRNWTAATTLLQERAGSKRVADVVEWAQANGVPVEPVLSVAEVAASDQWKVRGMVRSSAAGSRRQFALGPTWRIDGTRHRTAFGTPTPSPELGRVWPNDERSVASHSRFAGTSSGRPLDGIRVLELTTAWAGPLAGRALAYLGADVIKIESASRPDTWRGFSGGSPEWFPDGDEGERPYNRSVLFNTQNLDKRSLIVDVKAPGGLQLIHDLVRRTDVVLANFAPGVLDRIGLGHTALRSVNDQVIVVEMPAFGAGGPITTHVGMGKTMEAACGMASLLGYGDGRPQLTGQALLDPMGSVHAVAAVLTALEARERLGAGVAVEVAQTEAAAHWIGEYFLQVMSEGETDGPAGNHVSYAAPHDCYPSSGDDEWLAVAVRDDHEWQSLCSVIGRPDLAADPLYATYVGRHMHEDRLSHAISAWSRTHDKHHAARALQTRGVPAAPVFTGADVARDPALAQAGMVIELMHADAGRHRYPTVAYRLSRTPGRCSKPAPLFGEHSEAILRDLLGRSDEDIAVLRQAGTIADEPLAAAQAGLTAVSRARQPRAARAS